MEDVDCQVDRCFQAQLPTGRQVLAASRSPACSPRVELTNTRSR